MQRNPRKARPSKRKHGTSSAPAGNKLKREALQAHQHGVSSNMCKAKVLRCKSEDLEVWEIESSSDVECSMEPQRPAESSQVPWDVAAEFH